MATIRATEVRKAAKDVRRFTARSLAMLDAGMVDEAYQYAEAAQHAAFDMKALVEAGGTYVGGNAPAEQ